MKIVWDALERPEWEALADRARAPMAQRWNYGAAHVALGGAVARAVVHAKGRPVALAQLLVRRLRPGLRLALASNGPLWLAPCDQGRVLRLIRRSLPLPAPRLCLFTLPAPGRPRRTLALMRPATTARRALPVAREELHGKWRNALKKGEKSGLELRHETCSAAGLRALLRDDLRQQHARGYRALPGEFSLAWQRIAPGDLRLFSARKGADIHAQALVLRHGNTASYHLARSSAAGRASGAARLVLWHAFAELALMGVGEIDLGLLDTENAPGLARFKLGTGARAVRLGPTLLSL